MEPIRRSGPQPLPASARRQLFAVAGHQPGPAEKALLKDADSLSFRVKVAIFDKVNTIDDRAPATWKVMLKVIKRFAKVPTTSEPGNTQALTPGLMRGEQPNQRGFEFLARQGFRTVINLTEESNHDALWAPKAGLKVIYQPQHGYDAPTLAQARDFLKAATNPANQPVYFHCYHGSDRTGTMAAVYRIAVEGWSADRAIAELAPHHFNTPFEMAKLQFIRDFAGQWQGRAVELMADKP